MLIGLTLLVLLGACGEGAPPEVVVDTDLPCDVLRSGDDWAFTGECPQMMTPCEVEFDACKLHITYSSGMTMGMPFKATIEGDVVTFKDGDVVTGCVGTIESKNLVTGTCDGECSFTLER